MKEALFRVTFPVDDELRDALSECLLEHGAEGLVSEPGALVVYGDESRASALEAAFALFQEMAALAVPEFVAESPKREPVDADYHRPWLERLRPVQLTERIVLCPRGKESLVKGADKVLFFEPQPSFGSGEHETTRMAARAIERLVLSREERARREVRLLDVGTGTGVLALVALMSGAGGAVGTDIDPISVAAARANAAANGLLDRLEVLLGTFPDAGEKFSLVVANIDRKTLISEAGSIGGQVASGGDLLLTGFLLEDVADVEAPYLAQGFVRQELEEGVEFARLSLRRP